MRNEKIHKPNGKEMLTKRETKYDDKFGSGSSSRAEVRTIVYKSMIRVIKHIISEISSD